MASMEERVKDLESRASSGARARFELAVKIHSLDKRVQKLEEAAAPPGVPQDAAPRWHSDLKFVEESRFAGKTSEQIFDEGYDEGLAAGRGEKEALIDQLTDELTESRERAAVLERLNNAQRETIRRLRSSNTQEETIRRLREQVDLHQETIRRLREQVDILQASHGSRGEVSKPAPEFKKGDRVRIVGPSLSGEGDRRGEVTRVELRTPAGNVKVTTKEGSRAHIYPLSSLELVERAS